MDDLPFRAEYAKSSRSSCKNCKSPIAQDTLRLARLVQSPKFDAKIPNWFHYECFFQKQRPKSVDEIEHFESLRYEDQEKIRKKVEAVSGVVVPAAKGKGKGKKRSAAESIALKDFGVEYAASGRSTCAGCQIKIMKDEVRIKKIVYDTEVGMKYGGQPLWHHVDCFAKLRDELGYFESGDKLPGYEHLTADDKKEVKAAVPAVKSDEIAVKKLKLEPKDEVDMAEDKALEDKIKKQTKSFYKFKDNLKANLSKQQLIDILFLNHSYIPEGLENLLERCSDFLAFGAIAKCTNCKTGDFVFKKNGYACNGALTEWVQCTKNVTYPDRTKCKIPSDLKKNSFLSNYISIVDNRAVRSPGSASSSQLLTVKKEENGTNEPRVKRSKPPLYEMHFVLIGKISISKDELKMKLAKLGGKLVTSIHEKIAAIISTPEEVEKMTKRMRDAKELDIQVVPESFIEASEKSGEAIEKIKSMKICDWGSDPLLRIPKEEEKKPRGDYYTKNVPSKVQMKIKGGTAIDPDSGLEDIAHVYKQGKDLYCAVLGLTDIQKNKNSYYKLQILESDVGHRYWLFRSWGRIGTTVGDHKLEKFSDVEDAIEMFEKLYMDKTQNSWYNRKNFQKQPGKMYPIDVDYDDSDKLKKLEEHSQYKSKLAQPVQDLVKLLFDVESMRKTMLSFELDMEKMPLGRLSKDQLKNAYQVLSELANLITNSGTNEQLIDASNRFYTLVPHTFGIQLPPVLDTLQVIKDKTDMLDSLMEIEVAYSMLNVETEGEINPIDSHYAQLKTEVAPIDHKSEEFQMLVQYVKNTHAKTHDAYDLIVEDAFKVKRQGEERRYKPFKKLHNRQLLWHGSRLTNYVGILSHGLKIAPPEAPVTGYMFGKGIYFADMVSKSANYCFTARDNTTGLVLLSEVALGNTHDLTRATYITKVPQGKHSVKGIGKTTPNPNEFKTLPNGVVVPMGTPVTDDKLRSDLLYNEYIVYDVSQVNIQYLLKLNFKYKK